LAYEVEYTATALRQLRKLDRQTARRIIDYLDDVARLGDPRSRGKALVGDRVGIWRYRVGDFRILCEFRDSELLIVALIVGHRGSVYDTSAATKAPATTQR
jgi:mRNA interferase RelE/StbE